MRTFTLQQIRAASDEFSPANKVGEGGFGPVYKGQLSDGTWVAVKQLSSKSRQGNSEFLKEMGMIFCLQHPNLVKLHGCCIEGDQLILVYEYMENNSLVHALFSLENRLKLDWPSRLMICIGVGAIVDLASVPTLHSHAMVYAIVEFFKLATCLHACSSIIEIFELSVSDQYWTEVFAQAL
ncbi:probable LRR receptor-like serine/threonine-protein kinase At1g53430 [Vicia villosa]|uniref:probable LRR receptor-like serine/threonine-protein kinase At1g53430 n=1 Tax=Vicia villosa TaxID=3911 RepID=UPI00273C9022|nr:probable LRR receptor-like serine/threonine-protein kinase At1g53430 [Vicia villosa]